MDMDVEDFHWTPVAALAGLIGAYFIILSLGIIAGRFLCRGGPKRANYGAPADSWRRRLHMMFYVQTNLGSYIDVAQGVFSAVSCLLYVYETYQTEEEAASSLFIGYSERILSALFVMDYSLRFFISKDRLMYVWSIFGIVDVITVLPVIVYITFPSAQLENVPTYLRLIRLIKFLRVMRSLRLVRATRGFGLRRRLYTLLLSVVSLIFVAAGGFHFLEGGVGEEGMSFHTALYYTTIETLGRPRIDAQTDAGFFWLISLVAISVFVIPKQIAELYSVACAETVYQRKYYLKRGSQHIVITGQLDFGSVNCILYEFYHKDRGYHSSDVVLFFDQPPTKEVEMLLEHPAYLGIVQYVQGSPLVEDDLNRVQLSTATAVVVLANKNPQDPFWEDCRTTSTVLSCKGFWHRGGHLRDHNHSRLRILAQVLKPSTREQLLRTPGWEHDDVILVISEFSSIMVGLNALHPGLTTLIFNLFSHVEEQVQAPPWYREYESGALQEIYRVVVGSSLAGVSMAEAAEYLLIKQNILLLAMEVASSRTRRTEILLYPGKKDYVLEDGDRVFCIAYNVFLAHASAETTPTMGDSWMIKASCQAISEHGRGGLDFQASNVLDRVRRTMMFSNSEEDMTALQWASTRSTSNSFYSDRGSKDLSEEKEASLSSPRESTGPPAELEKSLTGEDRQSISFVEAEHSPRQLSPRTSPRTSLSEIPREFSGDCVQQPRSAAKTRCRLPPGCITADTHKGRVEVMQWLLSSGYSGDFEAMRDEIDSFLEEEDSARRSSWLTSEIRSEEPSAPTIGKNTTGLSRSESECLARLGGGQSKWHLVQPPTCEVFSRIPSMMEGHVVVFGVNDPSALWDLARLILLRSNRCLVVLSPNAEKLMESATQEGWLVKLEQPGFRRLYFVKGNPCGADILEKVLLHRAYAAIFLPSLPPSTSLCTEETFPQNTERQHRMIDSATVSLTNFAAREATKVSGLWTVTQLLHGAAVKFFTDHSSWRGASADPRWCDIAPVNTHALFAAGQIVAGTMLDRLLIESYFNERAIQLLGLCIFGDEGGSHVIEQPMPESYVGKKYGELCEHLLRARLLPLGLLRESKLSYSCIFRRKHVTATTTFPPPPTYHSSGSKAKMNLTRSGTAKWASHMFHFSDFKRRTVVEEEFISPCLDTSEEAQLPYVVTNPDKELVLKAGDRLFLVGSPLSSSDEQGCREARDPLVTKEAKLNAVEAHDVGLLTTILTNSSLTRRPTRTHSQPL